MKTLHITRNGLCRVVRNDDGSLRCQRADYHEGELLGWHDFNPHAIPAPKSLAHAKRLAAFWAGTKNSCPR